MKKDKLKGLYALGSLLGATGLIFLFFSANIGAKLADRWLLGQGGFADTSLYEIMVRANTNNFLAAGSILFAVGLMTLVFSYYKMLNIEE
ncbi:hypothetical protein D1B33_14470 [Lysinibacillus yapensis]|uniref:Uncharacterized protein n=1 Tax=Ureibacillus yapensis TaxID=2304605 RepID=A0A396S7Z0_9BACL|nr:hypothetical protein [Lysinibacillus yapensis]RHW34004.1 hypothetical protein D1B33_14470 [Lysinibacillus yapensis]